MFLLNSVSTVCYKGVIFRKQSIFVIKTNMPFLTNVIQVDKIKQILLDLSGLKESQAKLNLIPGRPTCEHKMTLTCFSTKPSSKLIIAKLR